MQFQLLIRLKFLCNLIWISFLRTSGVKREKESCSKFAYKWFLGSSRFHFLNCDGNCSAAHKVKPFRNFASSCSEGVQWTTIRVWRRWMAQCNCHRMDLLFQLESSSLWWRPQYFITRKRATYSSKIILFKQDAGPCYYFSNRWSRSMIAGSTSASYILLELRVRFNSLAYSRVHDDTSSSIVIPEEFPAPLRLLKADLQSKGFLVCLRIVHR